MTSSHYRPRKAKENQRLIVGGETSRVRRSAQTLSGLIIQKLTRLISPTAEEPGRLSAHPSAQTINPPLVDGLSGANQTAR